MLADAELDEIRARLTMRILGVPLAFPFNQMVLATGEAHPSERRICELLVERLDAERAMTNELADAVLTMLNWSWPEDMEDLLLSAVGRYRATRNGCA